jgi:flagellar basal body-associated protein FliL
LQTDFEKAVKQSSKIPLIVGVVVLIFVIVIAFVFHHFFNTAKEIISA